MLDIEFKSNKYSKEWSVLDSYYNWVNDNKKIAKKYDNTRSRFTKNNRGSVERF